MVPQPFQHPNRYVIGFVQGGYIVLPRIALILVIGFSFAFLLPDLAAASDETIEDGRSISLESDDICSTADDDPNRSEDCALNALQRRAATSSSDTYGLDPLELAEALSRARSRSSTLDGTLGKKVPDPRCENCVWDGVTCTSHSDFIFCFDGKRVVGSDSTCTAAMADKESFCRHDPLSGIADHCDDSFCRSGRASDGDGNYCHNEKVVQCRGSDEPRVIDNCSDDEFIDSNGCKVTKRYTCMRFPDAQCVLMGTSRKGCENS